MGMQNIYKKPVITCTLLSSMQVYFHTPHAHRLVMHTTSVATNGNVINAGNPTTNKQHKLKL